MQTFDPKKACLERSGLSVKAGITSRAKSSIDFSTRFWSRSPNQKLQLKWLMPTASLMCWI